MKLRKLVIVAAALLMAAGSAQAADSMDSTNDENRDRYHPNELSIDGFGTYRKTFPQFSDMFDRSWQNGEFGGGVGLNYFITRYIGVGADTFFEEQGKFFKNVSGTLFLRYPIGHSGFAPYAFGGGGYRYSPVGDWTGHAGLGLEYRFTPHIGVFGDFRYIWADKTGSAALPRAGIRFAF